MSARGSGFSTCCCVSFGSDIQSNLARYEGMSETLTDKNPRPCLLKHDETAYIRPEILIGKNQVPEDLKSHRCSGSLHRAEP